MSNKYIQRDEWEETAEKVFAEIENCCSVNQLNIRRLVYTSLMEQIKDSRLFFRCEYNNNVTKITVSMVNEDFMNLIVTGCFSSVPDYIQAEISEQLCKLSEEVIERIDERISVVEKRNAQMKKREKVIMIAALSMGFALSLGINFHMLPKIMNILVFILLIIVAVIPICWLYRD